MNQCKHFTAPGSLKSRIHAIPTRWHTAKEVLLCVFVVNHSVCKTDQNCTVWKPCFHYFLSLTTHTLVLLCLDSLFFLIMFIQKMFFHWFQNLYFYILSVFILKHTHSNMLWIIKFCIKSQHLKNLHILSTALPATLFPFSFSKNLLTFYIHWHMNLYYFICWKILDARNIKINVSGLNSRTVSTSWSWLNMKITLASMLIKWIVQ